MIVKRISNMSYLLHPELFAKANFVDHHFPHFYSSTQIERDRSVRFQKL